MHLQVPGENILRSLLRDGRIEDRAWLFRGVGLGDGEGAYEASGTIIQVLCLSC